MRWRWPFRRRRDPATVEAIAAVEKQLAEARARDREVSKLVEQLRAIRERNNFAELLAASFRDRHR